MGCGFPTVCGVVAWPLGVPDIQRAGKGWKPLVSLAGPSLVFLLCPLMRISGAFRYFWPASVPTARRPSPSGAGVGGVGRQQLLGAGRRDRDTGASVHRLRRRGVQRQPGGGLPALPGDRRAVLPRVRAGGQDRDSDDGRVRRVLRSGEVERRPRDVVDTDRRRGLTPRRPGA
jgi:hypothetical protein